MKGFSTVVSLLVVLGANQAIAQDYYNPAPPPAPAGPSFDPSQLSQMLAPIALYPDPLVAQILAAASQPSQIAVAANYVNSGGDPNAIASQSWDPSVQAIAHYPQVLQLLNGNLQWTAQLGQAYMSDPQDVMGAIQQLRQEAMQQGNLQSTPQEQVINDDGTVEIIPANPDMIYIPQYDPSVVYYQPGYGLDWGVGFAIGPWLDFDFDWHDHRIIRWDRDHPRPGNWWHERPAERFAYMSHAPVWHPDAHRAPTRGYAPTVNRGDRGYAPQPERRGAPAPKELPRTQPAPREVARPEPAPREVARPEPAPREVRPAPEPAHVAPERPTAFSGSENAAAARASSSRGMESRGISAPRSAPSGRGSGERR